MLLEVLLVYVLMQIIARGAEDEFWIKHEVFVWQCYPHILV